jgi:hypothetical protein
MAQWEEMANYKIIEGKLYIFIPYHCIYCVKRDDQIIMCNGYVLVEPVEKEVDFGMLKVPNWYKKNELHVGKIFNAGSVNSDYYGVNYMDTIDYSIGDLVLFRRYNNVLHNDIMKEKPLYKMQRRQIIATLN